MPTFDQYRDEVREAILLRDGEALINGSIEHAGIITQEALINAQDSVRILSYRLDPDCYADEAVLNAADYFLANPSHHLKILIEAGLWNDGNYDWTRHPLIHKLHQSLTQQNPNFEIRLVPKALAEKYAYNFLVLDDYGYRYEEDRKRPTAVARFLPIDDPKKEPVVNLTNIFDSIWEGSEPLDLNKKKAA
ncbi:MAG: hypothetical protein ABSC26_04990 [Stellaceae bacterium]|jgi:hypothetical protein